MKFIYLLITMLVGMAIGGEWQKPVGNLNGIKAAIKAKTLTVEKVEQCDKYGYNAIHLATYTNSNVILKTLLSSGFVDSSNINTPNDFGETPLMMAAMNGNLEAVKMLIGTGKYTREMIYVQDQDGNQAIMYSFLEGGNVEIAKIILGASKFLIEDLEKKNANNESAMSYAMKSTDAARKVMEDSKAIAHKNTLPELRIVHSALPMLKRGE